MYCVQWKTLYLLIATCTVIGVASCKQRPCKRYREPVVISEYTVLQEDEMRKMRDDVFECICKIKGRTISCMLVNRSPSCVLYDYQEDGPVHYLDYEDITGNLKTDVTPWVESMYYPHLVALYPEKRTMSEGAIHSFDIAIPQDCRAIQSLVIVISYIPFSEMGKISDINDLRDAFARNKAKITAVFEQ